MKTNLTKAPCVIINRDEQLFDEWFNGKFPLKGSRAQSAQRQEKRELAWLGWQAARYFPVECPTAKIHVT